jgi:large subunit ribosomal protein L19
MVAGAAVLAFSTCAAIGMLLTPGAPGVSQLHTTVGVAPAVNTMTAPISSTVRSSLPRQASVGAISRAHLVEESQYDISATQYNAQNLEGGTTSGVVGLLMIPVVAVVGFIAGRMNAKATPLSASQYKPYSSYAMMAAAGEAEAEEGDIEDLVEVEEEEEEPVVVEKSYAKIIANIEQKYMKENVPTLYPGDTVKIGVRIKEGQKERIQMYQGVIIAINNAGLHKSITVRAVLQGVGVERVFPLHAPQVASIEVVRRGKVRRSKLYYLRERQGKSARVKQRFDRPLEKVQW